MSSCVGVLAAIAHEQQEMIVLWARALALSPNLHLEGLLSPPEKDEAREETLKMVQVHRQEGRSECVEEERGV